MKLVFVLLIILFVILIFLILAYISIKVNDYNYRKEYMRKAKKIAEREVARWYKNE